MTRIDDLPADRRAVLELLVRHGKSYDDLATMLRIEPEKVRERARDALDRLGPLERKDELVDYLLGQQGAVERAAAHKLLEQSADARSWARGVAGELQTIAPGPVPDVPPDRRRADGDIASRVQAGLGLDPDYEAPPLPDRPALITPEHSHHHRFRAREHRVWFQPRLGLVGLFVVAVAVWILGVSFGGAESSLLIIGPISTFALPVIAMIALWWEDWPGSSLRGGWAGLVDTVIICVGAILLTMLGQIVVGHLDVPGVFQVDPGPDHLTVFPWTLPVAALAFTCMIHLTFVWEGWPLRQLGRFRSGVGALVISWVVAIVAYLLLADVPSEDAAAIGLRDPGGPVPVEVFGGWLVAVASWQALFFIGLNGWPFSNLEQRRDRLIAGNVVVIAGGWLTYLFLHHTLGWSISAVTAAGGCLIAAIVLAALLFDGWPAAHFVPARARIITLVVIFAGALVLYGVLSLFSNAVEDWEAASAKDWITFAGLNFIAGSAIIHVAIWERWPLHGMMEGEAGAEPAPAP
jgi:hypothetical protein